MIFFKIFLVFLSFSPLPFLFSRFQKISSSPNIFISQPMQLPEPSDSSQQSSGARIYRQMSSSSANKESTDQMLPTTSCYPTPSKPIDIRSATPNRNQNSRLAIHFNTAPANSNLHANMGAFKGNVQRPTVYSKPVQQMTNAQETLQRIYGMERQVGGLLKNSKKL